MRRMLFSALFAAIAILVTASTSPVLAHDGELRAYRHTGFWQPMDTLRDRTTLEALWASGEAPWKIWKH